MKRLLSREFDVSLIPVDGSLKLIRPLVTRSDVIYVLWQTEFLAPWLLALGHSVVLFPMYDGLGTTFRRFFVALDDAHLFSFSDELHRRAVAAGTVSHRVKYYQSAEFDYSCVNSQQSMFVWLRRPDSSLSERNVRDYFSPYIDGFHFHDRPDNYNHAMHKRVDVDSHVSSSNWFFNKEELFHTICQSRYYLAPRETEGIGMAFLEAMSLGRIVFANNAATHNEYIYEGHNGFLIDFDSGDSKKIRRQIARAFKILESGVDVGGNAAKYIAGNVVRWKEDDERIIAYFNKLSECKNRPRRFPIAVWLARNAAFFHRVNHAFGMLYITLLSFLSRRKI